MGCIFNSNVATAAGGGFWCTNSSVDIQGGQFTDNQAVYGGGISFDDASQGTVVGSLIDGNTSSNDGGGVYIEDASTPSLVNCVISNNTSSQEGGGVHYAYGSNPEIAGCTITGNSSGGTVGGGIFCANSVGTITDCVISNNDGSEGGGIYCLNSSPVISNSTFETNEQTVGGGHGSAIRFAGGGTPEVSDCIFNSNLGDYAIHNDGSNSSIMGSVFVNNTNGVKCAGGGGSVITDCCFWQTGVAINGCTDGAGNTFDFDCTYYLDEDGDGIPDGKDICPRDPDNVIDNDGVCGDVDAFPNDPTEWADSDGDGVGDNGDAFPNDPSEWADSDGDGVGDNGDAFPNDPTEWADSDGDGVGDNGDAFPNDSTEWTDSDGDGVGDNEDTAPRGPCCVDTGCMTITQVRCDEGSGTWLGEGGSCDDCPTACVGDIYNNGVVDINDLLIMLGNWGPCP
jgi:parallel beta-helix repeat protein